MNTDQTNTISVKKLLSQINQNDHYIEIDPNLRIQLQKLLFSMFMDVHSVCEKYGLSLFLCGGSALGTVRHQGFIPWDDDLDMTMTRDDYNRFQEIFEQELSDRYLLLAPGYKNGSRSRFPKVMKKGTIFREVGNSSPEEECGVFLDIFILDNVPNNKVLRLIKGSFCNILEFISGQVLWREEKAHEILEKIKEANRKQYYIRKITGIIFSFKTTRSWNRILDKALQHKNDTRYCTLATGRKHYFGEMLPREVFLPGTSGVFEGQEVLLFSDPDVYLSNLYGDYMQIPEESKREKHIVKEIRL